MPVSSGSFDSRKALPQEWRGLRDDALSSTTGVAGSIFVHASGFIGGKHRLDGRMRTIIFAQVHKQRMA